MDLRAALCAARLRVVSHSMHPHGRGAASRMAGRLSLVFLAVLYTPAAILRVNLKHIRNLRRKK
eukprot:513026-Karenia_brevis.AAC.1